jgi:enoyl-CoA hydratase/carnithine racemase
MGDVLEFQGKFYSFSKENKIAVLHMNRPPANALDHEATSELHRAVTAASYDPNVNVIIIRSENPKVFCGGADISTVEAHDVAGMDELGVLFKNLFLAMRASTKIFIADIRGHCLGGGLELALACDFRFAVAGSYKVGLPEVNLGLFPGGGAIQMMARITSPQIAYALAATGELISPEEAARYGIFDRLLSAEQHEEELLKFAGKLASGPSIAIANMKQAVYRGTAMSLLEAFDFERHMHKHLVATEDCKEGVRAFKEKRAPQFIGK